MSVPERTPQGPSIEPLLRTALRKPATPATADCLDAETLAAWSDGTLSEDRARQVESHVADCARCQMLMAAFARTEPVAPAVLPFWRRSSIQWLLPLAAAASLVIWIAWPGRKTEAPSSTIARMEPSASIAPAETKPFADKRTDAPPPEPTSTAPSPPAMADELRSAASEPVSEPRQKSIQRKDAAEVESSLKKQQSNAALQEPRNETAKSRDAGAIADNKAIDGVAPLPNPAPVEAPRAMPAPAGPANIPPVAQKAIAASPAGLSGVVFEVAAQGSPARRETAAVPGGGARGGAAGRPVDLSVSASISRNRWRVLASGGVERTTDRGQSWEPITIDPAVTLSAGSAPSALVCWLVGPQGVILVTSDGVHFVRAPFTESTDLVSVSAADAQHATVTTADGRPFTTADGGASWRAGRE
jgi:hypothetical protein